MIHFFSPSIHELYFPSVCPSFLSLCAAARLQPAVHLVIYFIACSQSFRDVYFSVSESWQRFCLLKKDYMESFEAIFQEQYDTIHRLETNKLRNVARMFAHLLYTDSVPWSVSWR